MEEEPHLATRSNRRRVVRSRTEKKLDPAHNSPKKPTLHHVSNPHLVLTPSSTGNAGLPKQPPESRRFIDSEPETYREEEEDVGEKQRKINKAQASDGREQQEQTR
ncbi:hypothetical protein YC2023_043805 [Brassica napus]|uniref:(rape) hypothetical protein n=1 Tax=Brassica napus TaxID=3708 RepID=A0A816IVZ6_BRANA|nr:unnamed protein product [Brassica napus]